MNNADLEQSIRHCYSTWGDRYYADYYQSKTAYPPVHTDIIRDLLRQSEAKTLLDAGCGPASMLRDLDLPNLERFGFDLTPEMTAEARRVLATQNVPDSHIWEGSVLEASSFQQPGMSPPPTFDAVICFGVLPHIPAPSDLTVLTHLTDAVSSGGWVACEARNQLFALFTLNRYSADLFKTQLIQVEALRQRMQNPSEELALDQALEELDQRFRMDLPPLRKGYEQEPGYDEVLSRTHNPFELAAVARQAGLVEVQCLFYHYHALPPILEPLLPQAFRRESIAMENPTDWRGHFMASAFIVVGKRP
ncbi:class I SAM-dependent methyltransferase [Leptolyngbya sp. PCC 6406]|uniref:class I SAM-dependent methyltransferase n=1 Tax=Leptolyngbya sp. PCC 6406 TaxID=1173264 RepID=UPI0002AC48B2|nr:methyltransferase [Leptolyngbya sp. PCC 6406]